MALQKINTDLISADAVTAAKIADGAITADDIGANNITGAKIASNSILTRHIDDNQVTADQIAAATITTTQIAANTIATGNIADNAIDSTKIASNSILTRHIDDDQVTGDQLADAITIGTSAQISQVALTSTSNAVAWDATAAANAYHLLTENTTFSAPSNAAEGAIIQVEIAQGGTPYTVAWNTVFEFAASTAPVVTATANKTDILTFRYNGSVWQEIGRVQNLAQT